MRLLFSILVIANLVLAAYALFGRPAAAPEASRMPEQINADQIQVIPPRPPAPARPAACVQWGSFAEAETDGARRALAAAGLAESPREIGVPVVAGWWVYIPPLPDRAAVERSVRELQTLGVTEYYVVDADGPTRNAISLGIFRTEDAARWFLGSVQARGVRAARVGEREHRVTHTAFVLRDPDAQASARLAELALRFPGTELRSVDCPQQESEVRSQRTESDPAAPAASPAVPGAPRP
jgi:hypothetical protein